MNAVDAIKRHFAKMKFQHTNKDINNALSCVNQLKRAYDDDFETLLNDLYPEGELRNAEIIEGSDRCKRSNHRIGNISLRAGVEDNVLTGKK